MGDRYDNLDKLDLFESRNKHENLMEVRSKRLKSKVTAIDAIFDDAVIPLLVYPIEKTLFEIHTNNPISEPLIFGLVGKVSNVTALDDTDINEYRGEYLFLETVKNVILKIGCSERDSHRTDLTLENMRFEIPCCQLSPKF